MVLSRRLTPKSQIPVFGAMLNENALGTADAKGV
jgi:hypothetical protein